MNAKNLVLVNCVKAIIYLLLYNLHECTFKNDRNLEEKKNFIKVTRLVFY